MRLRLLTLATVLAPTTAYAAVPATTASAAYAPKLTVTTSSTKVGDPIGITTTISQMNGETNSKKVVVKFPQSMGVNPNTQAAQCPDAQAANFEGCPQSSRLGTARATVPVVGELTGGVYLGKIGETIPLVVYLKPENGLFASQKQIIRGAISLEPTGPVTTFDGLPDPGLTITSFTLALDGPPNTLVANPGTCGTFQLTADFTSQKGETATSSAPFSVTGCPPPNVAPKLTKVALLKGGRVRFTLSERADVTVRLFRGSAKGKEIRRIDERPARKGTNTFRGLFPRRKLPKGRYVISVRASDSEGALSKRLFLRYTQR